MGILTAIVGNIKYRYLEFKWDRILKKSRYDDWEEYLADNDSRYNPKGSTIRECLQGYPYIVVINQNELEIKRRTPFLSTDSLKDWCNQHTSSYRLQSFFVYPSSKENVLNGRIVPPEHTPQYWMFSQVAIEVVVVGFCNPDDAALCNLIWG